MKSFVLLTTISTNTHIRYHITLVQRHIAFRRPQSVGMPFDDVWQIRPCEVTAAVAASSGVSKKRNYIPKLRY